MNSSLYHIFIYSSINTIEQLYINLYSKTSICIKIYLILPCLFIWHTLDLYNYLIICLPHLVYITLLGIFLIVNNYYDILILFHVLISQFIVSILITIYRSILISILILTILVLMIFHFYFLSLLFYSFFEYCQSIIIVINY